MGEAVAAQRQYALLRHPSPCMGTHLHNQMQLSWNLEDIVGVYFVSPTDERFARRLLGALVQRRSSDGRRARKYQLCELSCADCREKRLVAL